MSTRILLIAHAPLAHALRACALHVFPDTADDILALDVHPNAPPEDTLAAARNSIGRFTPVTSREPLEALVARAIAGGTQGVMQVAVAAPQNQTRRSHHDQDEYHHQQ